MSQSTLPPELDVKSSKQDNKIKKKYVLYVFCSKMLTLTDHRIVILAELLHIFKDKQQ